MGFKAVQDWRIPFENARGKVDEIQLYNGSSHVTALLVGYELGRTVRNDVE